MIFSSPPYHRHKGRSGQRSAFWQVPPIVNERAYSAMAWPEPAALFDEARDRIKPFAGFHIGENKWLFAAHSSGVALHDIERGADMRGKIDFIDDEKIRTGNARPAFAGDFFAARNINDIEGEIGEVGRESRGEIIPARFDKDQIELWKTRAHRRNGGEIDRGILADRGMRTAAGLDAKDALGVKRSGLGQNARIFLGVNVIGDRGYVIEPAKPLAELFHQGRLAGADRAANADTKRAVLTHRHPHDRNSREYCVSCRIEAMS